jgi:hypothetical protein
MNESLKKFLIDAIQTPIVILIASIVVLLVINKLPIGYKLKLRLNILAAKLYFFKNGESSCLNLWFKILDEAMQSKLDFEDLKDFISNYIDAYMFKAKNTIKLNKNIYTNDKIIKISLQYIKNKNKLEAMK